MIIREAIQSNNSFHLMGLTRGEKKRTQKVQRMYIHRSCNITQIVSLNRMDKPFDERKNLANTCPRQLFGESASVKEKISSPKVICYMLQAI